MKSIFVFVAGALVAGTALAKLPAPDDAAKAKAAETAAKTAWQGKVDGFQLCKAQDRVAAQYLKTHKGGKPAAAPACADPGPFTYAPPGQMTPVAAAAPAAPAKPAAPAAAKKK